jgi:hypothetical protein
MIANVGQLSADSCARTASKLHPVEPRPSNSHASGLSSLGKPRGHSHPVGTTCPCQCWVLLLAREPMPPTSETAQRIRSWDSGAFAAFADSGSVVAMPTANVKTLLWAAQIFRLLPTLGATRALQLADALPTPAVGHYDVGGCYSHHGRNLIGHGQRRGPPVGGADIPASTHHPAPPAPSS